MFFSLLCLHNMVVCISRIQRPYDLLNLSASVLVGRFLGAPRYWSWTKPLLRWTVQLIT
uniref:Uncharacterized protein n=1 Tax=Aegilops tauschii subsp. strangulata TaxID=200361 RepID=A0A452YEZ5_AEGTS